MGKWLWIAPALLLAGCTRSDPVGAVVDAATAEILVPAGTRFEVRLDEPLNNRRNRAGDSFFATLESPVQVDGIALIPAGTRFTGRVTAAEPLTGMEGPAVLAVELQSFSLDSKRFNVRTNVIERQGSSPATRHIGFITRLTPAGEGEAASSAPQPVGMPADSRVTFALRTPLRM